MTTKSDLQAGTAAVFDADAFFAAKPILICDIETYKNFFLVSFQRLSDGKRRHFELSDRSSIDLDSLRAITMQNRIVTYNGMNYDIPMIFYALTGVSNIELKRASDRIINGNVKYWQVEDLLGIQIPRKLEHWDLMEPQPNAFASLKTLNGRMHGPKMQDLPYEPDAVLSHAQMDEVISYCWNDIEATASLFYALKEPLALRAALGPEFGFDFMSKSDAQLGETIIKKRVEKATGERIQRVDTPAGTSFGYKVPDWAVFTRPDLREVVDRLREIEFYVQGDGKVELPKWLSGKQITIGETTYAMGIGGLHSTEANRAVHSDENHQLIDADVESQYPNIILSLGLYPKAVGPKFLPVYGGIKDDRVAAKMRKDKVKDQGYKIALNGGGFGKLGSRYSFMFAPHLLIAVTLTGQLSLLLLIERAEAAGISVVSGNTDGVVFRCPLHLRETLDEITAQWQRDTSFKLEFNEYESLYNLSVNTYIAVKPDGKVKRKGTLSNPWKDNDIRGMLMKNPNAVVCSDAVAELIVNGTPIEETIRGCTDIRDFVTVVNVKGGGTWRGGYLGKVVRYYWAHGGEEIFYKTPHERTGNFKKVPRTDGCRPLMDLPDEVPADIDYDRYIAEANEILMDIGYTERPPVVKPIRLFKYNAVAYFALAV